MRKADPHDERTLSQLGRIFEGVAERQTHATGMEFYAVQMVLVLCIQIFCVDLACQRQRRLSDLLGSCVPVVWLESSTFARLEDRVFFQRAVDVPEPCPQKAL